MVKKVIIADDMREARILLCAMVENYVPDASIDSVDNGKTLVQKVKEGDYDLILTDYHMGQGMDGIEAIKAIREFNKKAPIYMISGSSKLEEALKAGATGYLEKPFKSKEIQEITSKHLSQ